ncbi:hypothetical protein LCGC14_3165910 [marine sediment metagenome]|uniref:Uncharacterized protein n=1 Tax=marine sediment metagenome TaxID=412755 RepID=A0A0F8WAT8_9ZZZZ
MYRILCQVSGGVTDYRSAYLKERGVEVTFNTKAQAQIKADQLTESVNSNPNLIGLHFSYTLEKVD